MLKLDLKKELYWMPFPGEVSLQVRPFTTALMNAALSIMQRKVIELREEHKRRLAAGEALGDLPDMENEDVVSGLAKSLLTTALAQLAVVAWKGVFALDGISLALVTADNVHDLMQIWHVADRFYEQYLSSASLLDVEGNGLRPAVNGTSAAGHDIAKDATPLNSPAPAASPAQAASAVLTP